MTEDH